MTFPEFVTWIFVALLAVGSLAIIVRFAIGSYFDHKMKHVSMLAKIADVLNRSDEKEP